MMIPPHSGGDDMPADVQNGPGADDSPGNMQSASRPWKTPWRPVYHDGMTLRDAAPNGRPGDNCQDADDSATRLTGGLHEVIKGCEVSFGIEAGQIERRAIELAGLAAEANLPRMEVEYDEVWEETQLAAQCRSAFYGWIERVRLKVQDALQGSTQDVSSQLRTFEHEIGALETALVELPVRREELKIAEAAAEAGRSQLTYRPYMSKAGYYILISLLVIVDWIANVPVFTELLPRDPFVEEAWRGVAGDSESLGLLSGAYRMVARTAFNLEASLMALGLIIALVWLAHALGQASRRLVSHSAAEDPKAMLTIAAQRRQAWIPVSAALLSVIVVVGVLWSMRARLDTVAQGWVTEVNERIGQVDSAIEVARSQRDLTSVGHLQQERERFVAQRSQRLERADYAATITSMNMPILLLNVVLAFTAALAAYLSTSETVDGIVVNPRVAWLRSRVSSLLLEAGERRNRIMTADTAITRQFSRIDYLLQSKPFNGWQAKAEQLNAVIPSFRAENARRRGVDTANILAFRTPVDLNLTLDENAILAASRVDEHRALHASLVQRSTSVSSRIDTALSA